MIAPRIETERLVLRGFSAADVAGFTAFFADGEATRFLGGPRTAEEVYTQVSAYAGHWALYGLSLWAIEEKASGRLAGFTGYLNPPDWPMPEIGWSVFPALQGRGYATEAARAARVEIVRRGGPARLVSYIHPDNAASRRVAEKLGAVPGELIELRGGTAQVWRHPELPISQDQVPLRAEQRV